ncbi:hypothetical protein TNIN_408141, partial [Trichonephila inaurata madagascariensis]
HVVTGCKRRNPSSNSKGPQRKKNRGPERQLNKRGLPSSSNLNCHLNKKLRQSEESIQQREAGPYHLCPRNKVTKEASSRSSRGEMQDQGGTVRSRGERYKRSSPYNQSRHYRQQSKHQSKPEQEPRNGRSSRQSPRKVETPDNMIARRRTERQRVGGPHRLKSSLE